MKARFFTIADVSNYPMDKGDESVIIESHIFDTEDEDDIEILEEYLPTVEGISKKSLEITCIRILEDGCDWSQRMVPYLILTEDQMKELGQKIQKL